MLLSKQTTNGTYEIDQEASPDPLRAYLFSDSPRILYDQILLHI